MPAANPKPRGIAITPGGKVYVTSFLAQLRDDGRTVDQKEGRDDGKEGRVTVIIAATDTVLGTVVLNPLADAGFNSNGSVLDRIPATDPPDLHLRDRRVPEPAPGHRHQGRTASTCRTPARRPTARSGSTSTSRASSR